jgi:hypothetical protein
VLIGSANSVLHHLSMVNVNVERVFSGRPAPDRDPERDRDRSSEKPDGKMLKIVGKFVYFK